MLSLRAIARSIPRAAFRPASSSFRSVSFVSKPTLQSSWKPALRPSYQSFSTSMARRESAGASDQELSAKIENELMIEKSSRDTEDRPDNIKEFLENGPFELHDAPGQEKIKLTRKFGDETITVIFSVEDLNSMQEDSDELNEDRALSDEDDDGIGSQSGGAQSKGAINQGRTSGGNISVAPEDRVAPADRPEMADDEDVDDGGATPAFPVTVDVTITKPGEGAIQFQTMAQDGLIEIDNVSYFPKAEMAEAQTAVELERQNLYKGPPFGNLDEDLQVMMERYLDERGINTALANFVPDYIELKEQREYVQWLSNVKGFIDA